MADSTPKSENLKPAESKPTLIEDLDLRPKVVKSVPLEEMFLPTKEKRLSSREPIPYPNSEKESVSPGLQKYLNSLERTRPKDHEIVNEAMETDEKAKKESKRRPEWTKEQDKAWDREEDEYIRDILPQVVSNLKKAFKLLEGGEPRGGVWRRDHPVISTKVYGDLGKLLNFEGVDLRYPLGFLVAATASSYHLGVKESVYKASLDELFFQLGKESNYSDSAKVQEKDVKELLIEQAKQLGLRLQNKHHIKPATSAPLEWWARKIDPEWYEQYEDRQYRLDKFTV